MHHCVMGKVLTWWMSQWMSSSGTWTWWVFLSTVRLRWVLSRSSFTVCQWKSSNRLPNDTRSRPPEKELIPENKLKNKQKNLLKKPRFHRNYLKSTLQFTVIDEASTIKYLTYIIVWALNRGSGCFMNGQASNTIKVALKYTDKFSQLPHYIEVVVLLFKTIFGRIPNHLQVSRTAMSLYPRVPVKLYFLNNWYLYPSLKIYYLWK